MLVGACEDTQSLALVMEYGMRERAVLGGRCVISGKLPRKDEMS